MKRTIGLVTSARSDWGIQRSVAQAVRAHAELDLQIIATGMHLVREFGHTVDQIMADGFEVAHRVESQHPGDTPESIALSMGRGVSGFAELFSRWRPDILTVLGDRFDMFPAVVAATPFLIPIAHMHGGEVTLGAFDDALRHAMTKMSHIHLVSTEIYAQRILQMGENPRHVHVVGAPGLDDILKLDPIDDAELQSTFGFEAGQVNLLVAYHPETRSYEQVAENVAELLAVLDKLDANVVVVRPNADTAHRSIHAALDDFCERNGRVRAPTSLPRRAFLSLMRSASAMVGNSSAGILEAPSFGTPVVNIGRRQEGRVRAGNVIDCAANRTDIDRALRRALSSGFRESLVGLRNPYGDGRSSERIADILAATPVTRELVAKQFFGLQGTGEAAVQPFNR